MLTFNKIVIAAFLQMVEVKRNSYKFNEFKVGNLLIACNLLTHFEHATFNAFYVKILWLVFDTFYCA